MFSVLETGIAGGVLGTDKIADAMKEFRIRSLEAGTATGDMAADFNAAVAQLQAMEDPIARNAKGVELFGTMWEDLGESVVLAVDTQASKMSELGGATDRVNEKFASIGTYLTNAKDQALLALKPLTDKILELANEYGPKIEEFFAASAPIIEDWAANFGPALVDAVKTVADSLVRIGKALGIINPEAKGMDAHMQGLAGTLDGITWVLESVAWAFDKVADAVEIASGLIDQLGTIINHLSMEPLRAIAAIFSTVGPGAMMGNLLGFAEGGVVPGPIGSPQLAVVHGGETITPAGGAATNIYIDGINDGSGGDIDEGLRVAFEMLRDRIQAVQG